MSFPRDVVGYSVGSNISGLRFTYSGTYNQDGVLLADSPFIISPASGTAPGGGVIGLNPNRLKYLPPSGGYYGVVFTSIGQTPELLGGVGITLSVPSEPPPTISAIANSASLQPNLAPGALVTITGSWLTGPTVATEYDVTASYPTSVATTSVYFNGVAAPLVYMSPTQINAIVPWSLAGQTSAEVYVKRFQRESNKLTIPLQATAPAIFTLSQNGSGQGVIQQGTGYNGPDLPAAAGAALALFVTGSGPWYLRTSPGDVAINSDQFRNVPMSMTVGGHPSVIAFAGANGQGSPYAILWVLFTLPSGLAPGPQPIVIKIGDYDNSRQNVTVWVQ